MRYVVAMNASGVEMPFLGLVPQTHKDLASIAAKEGFSKLVSAGFVHFGPAMGVTTHFRSEGLGLAPRPVDAPMIDTFYRATLSLVPGFRLPEPACPKCEATGNADPLNFQT